MSTGIEKTSIVGTAATIASLIYSVIPQIVPLPIRLLIALGIGGLTTFAILASQSTELKAILNESAYILISIARRIPWLFCQIVHFLAIALNKFDRALHKLNDRDRPK